MYTLTAGFRAALPLSHQVAVKADLLYGGTVIRAGLPVVGGQVQVDGSAAVRRQADVSFVDELGDLTAPVGTATGKLSPYGNELAIYRGIKYASGGSDLIPLGVFRIATGSVGDDGARQLDVTCYDRSRTVARNVFTDPYIIAAGVNYVTAVTTLINDRLPAVQVQAFKTTTQLTPLLVLDVGADPWEELQKMCTSFGAICYFDQLGRFVIADDPTVSVNIDPVWTYVEGQNATLLRVSKAQDDDPGYNGVLLSAESTTLAAPLRSIVWDSLVTSPTYYLGPYGKVPMVTSSPYPSTQAGADAAATLLLQQNIGGTEQISFDAIPNPAHDAGDLVRVTRIKAGIDDLAYIQSLSIPLDAGGSMSVTCKKRRTLS